MKFVNPFKSLTWNSLFQASRNRRLRRRRPSYATPGAAAEVLEQRALLTITGNVAVALSGTALTLTSDNTGNHDVNVYRLDATHVEVDGVSGTTINGSASKTFSISSVSGITVNLGNGYDTYDIFSKSGDPALNIGAGGMLFKGAGGAGDDLEVYNDSANAMTIAGGITVQGATLGSTLTHSGSTSSDCEIDTDGSGSLTVNGSISVNEKGTGSGSENTSLFTQGHGGINILGSVTQTLNQSGSGNLENGIYTDDTGSLSIGGSLTQIANSANNSSFNAVAVGEQGNVTVTGAVTQTATAGSSNAAENLFVDIGTGNLTIGGPVRQTGTTTGTGSGSDAENVVLSDDAGNVTIGGGVTETANAPYSAANAIASGSSGRMAIGGAIMQVTTGTANNGAENDVFSDGSGALTVGLSVTQNSTSTGAYADDYVYADGSGNVTIGAGGITINESVSAATDNSFNQVYADSTGSLSTTGLIVINSNSSSGSSLSTKNEVYTNGSPGATVSALGIVINDAGSEKQRNYVDSEGAAITVGILGITITGSGSGFHDNEIYTDSSSSPIAIAGSVSVTDKGTGHSYFLLEADNTNSPVTVGGNVSYDNHLNTVGRSEVQIFGSTDDANSILTIKGSVIVTLAQTSGTANDNQGVNDNQFSIGEDEGTNGTGYGAAVNGQLIITGSNGQDDILIQEAQLKLGMTINTFSNPSPGATFHDLIEVDGSAFGGSVLVMMSGPNAEIDINNGNGFQPTIFTGFVEGILTGSNSLMIIAGGTGSGYSSVAFDAGALLIGSPGAGDIVKAHFANITGSTTRQFFTIVSV